MVVSVSVVSMVDVAVSISVSIAVSKMTLVSEEISVNVLVAVAVDVVVPAVATSRYTVTGSGTKQAHALANPSTGRRARFRLFRVGQAYRFGRGWTSSVMVAVTVACAVSMAVKVAVVSVVVVSVVVVEVVVVLHNLSDCLFDQNAFVADLRELGSRGLSGRDLCGRLSKDRGISAEVGGESLGRSHLDAKLPRAVACGQFKDLLPAAVIGSGA